MISSKLPTLLQKIESDTPQTPEDFRVFEVNVSQIEFIAHQDNPLESLTAQQVKDLFTGKIQDWSELGHPELGEIKIVTEHPTGGMFQTLMKEGLNGEDITQDRITMQNAPRVALVVSQLSNGFGFLSSATPDSQRKNIKVIPVEDLNIEQNMFLVTHADEAREPVLRLAQTISALAQDKTKNE